MKLFRVIVTVKLSAVGTQSHERNQDSGKPSARTGSQGQGGAFLDLIEKVLMIPIEPKLIFLLADPTMCRFAKPDEHTAGAGA